MENHSRLAPVAAEERLLELDVLRAIALFGILCVNMSWFRSSPIAFAFPEKAPHGTVDAAVDVLLRAFAYGKFNSMFSFLLGIGLTLQVLRAEERGVPFAGMYVRRLVTLLVFGLIHTLLVWYGDVLVFYALLGFLLLAIRKLSSPALFFIAAICLCVPVGLEVAKLFGPPPPPEEASALAVFAKEAYVALTRGSWWDTVRVNTAMNLFLFTSPLAISFACDLLVTLCLGLWVGRRRIFQNVDAHLPLIRRVNQISGAIGIPVAVAYAYFSLKHGDDFTRADSASILYTIAYSLGRPALMLFYVSGITLLLQRPTWRGQLSLVAPIGRMPLTNYLLQSVVCTALFYGWGGGLYLKIGYALGFALTIFIWLAQVPLSHWWMNAFRFGPVEWLWRSLTYARAQPMRRRQDQEQQTRGATVSTLLGHRDRADASGAESAQ